MGRARRGSSPRRFSKGGRARLVPFRIDGKAREVVGGWDFADFRRHCVNLVLSREGSTTEMKRVQLFPQMTMAYRACVGN